MFYFYDASGNRVISDVEGKTTFYVRDPQGNVLATYDPNNLVEGQYAEQKEVHLYGSSRLGVINTKRLPASNSQGFDPLPRLTAKHYELSNHLGNVLTTVTGRKLGMSETNTVDYYEPEVVQASDYYAFGLEMPGRKYNNPAFSETNEYRYGFNGKELDKSGEFGSLTHYDYGFRIYNPSIGKFLSVDPLTKSYPMLTPYQFASNSPIGNIDIDGLEAISIQEAKRISDEMDAEILVQTAEETAASIRGFSDAVFNANVLGLNQLFSDLSGYDPLNEFPTNDLKSAYLRGRMMGDAFATAQSIIQIEAGGGIAAGGLATGPGALAISTTGLVVAAHGSGVGVYALNDLARSYIVYNTINNEVPTSNTSNEPDLPRYENPGHHDPRKFEDGKPLPNKYDNSKSVLPNDHKELFKRSLEDPCDPSKRWTKVGDGKKTEWHRFSSDGNGNYHWSGSTNGKTKDNKSPRGPKPEPSSEAKKLFLKP